MPRFTVTAPDGKKYTIDGPPGSTQQDAIREVQKQIGSTASAPAGQTPIAGWQQLPGISEAYAVQQAALDPIEGAGQIASRLTGINPPQWLSNYLGRLRQLGTQNTPDRVLRTVGDILNPAYRAELPFEAAAATTKAVPLLQRGVRAAEEGWKALTPVSRAVVGGTAAGLAQPVGGNPSDPAFWRTKAVQAAAAGLPAYAFAQLAQRYAAAAGSQNAQEVAAAIRQGLQEAADRTNDLNQKRYIGSLFGHYLKTGFRDKAIADAAAERTRLQNVQKAIPNTTTQWWHQETLKPIGRTPPRGTGDVVSSEVQRTVGDARNAIIGQMSLDGADPSFADTINTIRSQTALRLNQANRAGWYSDPEKQGGPSGGIFTTDVLNPIAGGKTLTGRNLSDYLRRIGAEAERLAKMSRNAREPDASDYMTQARALRSVADAVVGHAAGTPALKEQLEAANRSYTLWSIGNDAAPPEKGAVATPAAIIKEWSGRQGDTHYRNEQNPQSPAYHRENARLKTQLDQLNRAHGATVPQPAMPAELPPKPQPRTAAVSPGYDPKGEIPTVAPPGGLPGWISYPAGYAAAEGVTRATGLGDSWAPRVAIGGALGRVLQGDAPPKIGGFLGRYPGPWGAAAGQAAGALQPETQYGVNP